MRLPRSVHRQFVRRYGLSPAVSTSTLRLVESLIYADWEPCRPDCGSVVSRETLTPHHGTRRGMLTRHLQTLDTEIAVRARRGDQVAERESMSGSERRDVAARVAASMQGMDAENEGSSARAVAADIRAENDAATPR